MIESSQSKPFQNSEIKFIVGLSGDHVLDKTLPITSQFSYSGLVRLVEGIRLYRSAGARLILSGGI